ncbi:bifunctional diguanylate cyclase/phosphodiesterase [Frankia sp. CIT1]|uniref:putative bifunctional diguanylate cyclase/phosphodiesterase n=1 Tax=Frankia sp. CIT1 TaxID=2880974 RepID=UPI001EF5CB8A|nr:bifunctional diguanylate cyclase/phosphodiesterase [Frankia sp. CIT1]
MTAEPAPLVGLVATAIPVWTMLLIVATLLAWPMAYAEFASLLGSGMCLAAVIFLVELAGLAVRFRPTDREIQPDRPGRACGRVDELTGLANRHGFLDQATHAFADISGSCSVGDGGPERTRPGSSGYVSFVLLLIDIDRFNEINGSLGNEYGDRLLIEVSRRISVVRRPRDIVARIGGDEFVLLLHGIDAQRARTVAAETLARVRNALEVPFVLAGMRVPLEAKIGIAVAPEHGRDVGELLCNAAIALREAKKARAGYSMYDTRLVRPSPAQLRLRTELRAGLQGGQIELRYQPKADLRTGRVSGMEALVRWRHPTDGVRSPDIFLPDMEAAGLMPELTLLVLRMALSECARWRAAGAELSVSVNVPVSVIVDSTFAPVVHDALGAAGVPPAAFCVEITEDSVMTRREDAQRTLARLRALGVRVSLDDYGTGYCSLAYLRDLPADELKLDRVFLRDIEWDTSAAEIVRSAIALAHTLRLRMVAEGVETIRLWALLAAWGCDEAQGYFISRPMTGDEVLPWLGQWARHPRLFQEMIIMGGDMTVEVSRSCVRRESGAQVAAPARR